jgi:Protein of unknown function (DUF2726)
VLDTAITIGIIIGLLVLVALFFRLKRSKEHDTFSEPYYRQPVEEVETPESQPTDNLPETTFPPAGSKQFYQTPDTRFYQQQHSLLSRNEQEFYHALVRAIPPHMDIAFQVALQALIYVPHNTPNYFKHFGSIASKHMDFVLYDCNTFRPRLVIELDDSTHYRAKRQARDEQVDILLRSCNLPILHIKSQSSYSITTLQTLITQHIN